MSKYTYLDHSLVNIYMFATWARAIIRTKISDTKISGFHADDDAGESFCYKVGDGNFYYPRISVDHFAYQNTAVREFAGRPPLVICAAVALEIGHATTLDLIRRLDDLPDDCTWKAEVRKDIRDIHIGTNYQMRYSGSHIDVLASLKRDLSSLLKIELYVHEKNFDERLTQEQEVEYSLALDRHIIAGTDFEFRCEHIRALLSDERPTLSVFQTITSNGHISSEEIHAVAEASFSSEATTRLRDIEDDIKTCRHYEQYLIGSVIATARRVGVQIEAVEKNSDMTRYKLVKTDLSQSMAGDSEEGPAIGYSWQHDGIIYSDMPATAWRLCNFLWTKFNRCSEYSEELAERMFGDRAKYIDHEWAGSHRKSANSFFKSHGIPWIVECPFDHVILKKKPKKT